MYVCVCKAISESDIKNMEGNPSLKEIQERTSAGLQCGLCLSRLKEIVRERDGQ